MKTLSFFLVFQALVLVGFCFDFKKDKVSHTLSDSNLTITIDTSELSRLAKDKLNTTQGIVKKQDLAELTVTEVDITALEGGFRVKMTIFARFRAQVKHLFTDWHPTTGTIEQSFNFEISRGELKITPIKSPRVYVPDQSYDVAVKAADYFKDEATSALNQMIGSAKKMKPAKIFPIKKVPADVRKQVEVKEKNIDARITTNSLIFTLHRDQEKDNAHNEL